MILIMRTLAHEWRKFPHQSRVKRVFLSTFIGHSSEIIKVLFDVGKTWHTQSTIAFEKFQAHSSSKRSHIIFSHLCDLAEGCPLLDLNFIPLWEWVRCHSVFWRSIRLKYVGCCQFAGAYVPNFEKAQVKCWRTCRDALWLVLLLRSFFFMSTYR